MSPSIYLTYVQSENKMVLIKQSYFVCINNLKYWYCKFLADIIKLLPSVLLILASLYAVFIHYSKKIKYHFINEIGVNRSKKKKNFKQPMRNNYLFSTLPTLDTSK